MLTYFDDDFYRFYCKFYVKNAVNVPDQQLHKFSKELCQLRRYLKQFIQKIALLQLIVLFQYVI